MADVGVHAGVLGDERNNAFGIYGAIAGSGASIGLLLGGVLTEYLNWRFAMYVNLAFAIVAIAGALTLLNNVPQDDKPRIDLPAPSRSRWACSASCSASTAPRSTAGRPA